MSSEVERDTDLDLRRVFASHLVGPCGEACCRLDARVTDISQRRREFLALERYISDSGQWARNPKARAVLSRLRPTERARLSRLSAKLYGASGRPSWRTLLSAVALDQVIFEDIIRQKRSGQLAQVAAERKVGEKRVRQVYIEYRKHAASSYLRDEPRPKSKLERAMLRHLGPPPVRETLPPMTWDAVFHWFAHALRNLCRYRDNHPKLPWSESCAERCLKTRDQLAGGQFTRNCE